MRRLVALVALVAGQARADPRVARELSASRDAPVLELAYGPRAQLSIGHELGLWSSERAALALAALAALENADSRSPVPEELARVVVDASLSVAVGARLAFAVRLGFERAGELRTSETDRPLPEPSPGDIPFGGGGAWLGLEGTLRLPLGPRASLAVRAGDRMFWNAFPLLVGRRAESDVVADAIGEGLAHAPFVDATARWLATATLRPTASLFAEGLFPHDRSADAGAFARLIAGVGIARGGDEILPFVSVDVGSGKGMLVNRHELRLSLGVRVVW